jgi:alpha-1,2-mannosyltransferase
MKADREEDYDQAVKPRVAATYLSADGHDQLAGRHGLLALVAIIGGAIGLYGWLIFVMAFDHNGPFGQRYITPGIDYMVYWRAARAAMAGDFALLADPVAFTAQISEQFHAWLSRPLPLFPWMYPPHFLLILMPFAVLPFAISYALFQVASFASAVAAGCCFWAGPSRRWALWALGLALSPAASMNVIAGQNAFLTLALLLGGMGLLGRSDFVAGLILGLLSYKPQFAIMVAVALLAARQWRALAGAIVSASFAIVLSAATFGFAPWRLWLGHTLPGALLGGAGDLAWSNAGRLWGLSVWACATVLGGPDWLANAAQGAAILLAMVCTWIAFCGAFGRDRRIAVLLTATLIAAPHVSPYDLVLLTAVVLLLYRDMLDIAIMPGSSLLLLPWSAPLVEVPRLSVLGFGVPVVMVCLLFVLLRPAASQAKTRN